MLTVNNVSKRYRSNTALSGVSFHLQMGDVLGLIGLNGAGKSTLLKGLAGVLPFISGEVSFQGRVLGSSNRSSQELIGYQPERPCLSPLLSPLQHVALLECIHEIPKERRSGRRKELFSLLALEALLDVPCGELSKGEQQRVGFLLATLHSPKLLLLDEPMSGLDPKQMLAFRTFVQSERSERVTILSTHLLQEVHALCNKFLILQDGKVSVFREDVSLDNLSHLEQYFLQSGTRPSVLTEKDKETQLRSVI